MSVIRKISTITAVTAIAATLQSCVYQYGPDGPGEGMRVTFDWNQAPDAQPEGMGVLMFPKGRDFSSRYDFRPAGGTATIHDGDYDIITLNNDYTQVLVLNDNDYSTLTLTTTEANPADGASVLSQGMAQPPRGRSEGQPVMTAPETIWTDALPDRHCHNGGTLTLTPRRVTATYRVTVDSIENLKSAAQASMAISGLALGYSPADSTAIDYTVTVPGKLRKSGQTSLTGTLVNWGKAPGANTVYLYVYIWLTDGTKRMYEFDVTGQVTESETKPDANIHVTGIELPEIENTVSGGMDVAVDNWETIYIELSLS